MSGDQSGPMELNGTGGGGGINGAIEGGGGGIANGVPGEGGTTTMNGGSVANGGGDGGAISPSGGGDGAVDGNGAGDGAEDAGGAGDRSLLDAGCSDGPPSIIGVGPPSPLTGCYLLIIIGEPHSQDHKDIILQRLIKGFLSWDVSDCHVDLEEELHTITLQALEGEEGKHGERLIQYASENLVTEILIHPQINTFIQCIRNLLSSFTRHRHIIHTGYTFAGNGSWVLQDGTFSVVDFTEAFQEHEVQRVLRAYPDTITMDVHCAPVGHWAAIQDKSFARLCRVRLNPVDVLSSGSDKLNAFVDYLASMIVPTEISELLESSDVVGNIRFSHPTLYVFPGGQGDAALFGINGFNMLVDGGFSRKSCFWDFVRHLDRLDAVLMTRINNTNIKGIAAVVERKNEAHVYPQIGHFFTNIPERKGLLSPDGDKDRDPLLVDLIEEGHQIVTNLKSLNLKAQNCYRDAEPVNLYHKVGHGTLDMYVISPAKDSKEVKEFLAKWHAADPKLFTSKDSKEFTFPIQNIISICALLVWTPANPEDNITRILFPGSAPEYKILEGLEKMKTVEFMRHPVCTVKSIAPSISTQAFTKKSLKSSSIDKIIPEPILPSKTTKPSEKDNRILDNKLKMIDNKLAESAKSSSDIMDSSAEEGKLEKHLTKSTVSTVASAKVMSRTVKSRSTESSAKKIDNKLIESSKKTELDEKKDSVSDTGSDKDDTEKKVTDDDATVEKKSDDDKDKKEDEQKDDSPTVKEESKVTKKIGRPATARSRIDSKPPKATKPIKKKEETNKSSPTTPKKTVEPKLTNGISEKKEEEPKKATGPPKTTKPVSTKPGKASPKNTPAKSAKDANNRKVLEARQRPISKALSAKKESTTSSEKRDTPPKVERKPISRRPKGAVPAATGSPVKAKKVLKSEKDAVIRKAKLDKNGTTDSSLVSTPSADEAGVAVPKRIGEPAVIASAGGSSDIDPLQQQHLAELKEEQEAVREIEAVFKRDSEKVKRRELLSEHREIQDSTTEPEEEEEYLIIEKEEQYTEDSINEPESSATKEEEIQKHQRDSEESEKRKRDSLEGEKEEKADVEKAEGETAVEEEVDDGKKDEIQDETQQDDKEVAAKAIEVVEKEGKEPEKMSPKHKQDIEEDVQEIIASAKEIAKSKMETSMDGLKTEEMSSISPDEKISSTKKTSDTRDENEPEPVPKEHIGPPHESHHEERVSATGESGATTTAPTLPEDERIPLDEIKEDLVIEEKYVKEETKEVEVAPPLPTVYEPLERPTPAKMQFTAQQAHMRDVVKTPDEVADLPMHEEADLEEYGEDKDKEDEKERDTKEKPDAAHTAPEKETEAKEPEKTDKIVADKSAESDKLCDTVKDAQEEVQEVIEKVEKDTKVEKPPKLEAQTSPEKNVLDEAAILKDLESQIIPKEVEIKKEVDVSKLEKTPDLAAKSVPEESDEEEDKKSVHEEVIVPKKVEPKVPAPSVLDDIWGTPEKAEEKLEELKQIIDDKAKETTSDLVTMKDEMVKEIVERKEEIVEKVKAEISDVDKKLAETVNDIASEAEKAAVAAADVVLKEIAAKADTVSSDLETKAKQLDDKMIAGVDAVKSDVEKVAVKADEVLSTIATEKKELEKMAKDIKEEVAERLDETKKQITDELNKKVEQTQEKAKSGISSFFGGIADGIKSEIEKIADKVETKIKDKTDQVESKLQQVTDKIDELQGKEQTEELGKKKDVAEVSEPEPASTFAYERSFTQELRETHITTVDSPISEADKLAELKSMINIPQHIDEDKELEELESEQMKKSFMIEEVKYSTFEDANLRDIKEEDEEDRITPPHKDEKKSSIPTLEPHTLPQRARTPEDVAKIVANVAEVLKSDKDLEEIIPGFDPQELERKLSQGACREEDVSTVQRMLVTASSEDGGEETDICPPGTITFSKTATPEPPVSGKTTPEIKVDEESDEQKQSEQKPEKPSLPEVKHDEKSSPASSGKSSPDLKTSPTSIEEKDKHELPEKVVIDVKKTPEKVLKVDERKESIAEQLDHIDDSRRESAISTFSERDYTKDESSFVDDRDSSRAHSISSHISDLKEDAADVKSVAEFLKESEKPEDKQDVFPEVEKSKIDVALTKKADELSSPDSVTSQRTVSEKSVAQASPEEKISQQVTPEKTIEAQLELGTKSPQPEDKTSQAEKIETTEVSKPESAAGEKAPSEKPTETQVEEKKELSRPESAASDKATLESTTSEKASETVLEESKELSRPSSEASSEKVSSEDKAQAKELPATIEKEASGKPTEESSQLNVAISEKSTSDKKTPEEKTEVKETSRPESATSEKPPSEKVEENKELSRPESAASEKATADPTSQEGKTEAKEVSRPESATSVKESSGTVVETKMEESKEMQKPDSAASVKEPSDAAKSESKEPSRPESAAEKITDATDSEPKLDVEKESSRPESAASQISEAKAGAVDKTSSEKLETQPDTKKSSRPESAASNVDEKILSEKVEIAPGTEVSRPESVASHVSEKAETTTEQKSETKETSRPESAASHVSEKQSSEKEETKLDIKDASRPASVASQVSDKAPSDKPEDKSETKDISRPLSAASHISDKVPSDNAESKLDNKEVSRPESAASHTSEKALPETIADAKEASRPESAEKLPSDDKTEAKPVETKDAPSKQESRPESAASHVSDKEAAKDASATPSDKLEAKDASRPESAASHSSEKVSEIKDAKKDSTLPDAKETSRPESVASHVSEKEKSDEKDNSRPESVASHVSEKASPQKTASQEKSDEKEVSRPVSVASHVSEKDSLETTDSQVKPEEKEPSRPESVASHVSEKASSEAPGQIEAKETSRPESVASHVSEKTSPEKLEGQQKVEEKEVSRSESVASQVSEKAPEKGTTLDKSDEKKDSRPESAISQVSEKAPSDKQEEKASEKAESRPMSATSHVSDQSTADKSPLVDNKSKEKTQSDSRPASQASAPKSDDNGESVAKGSEKEQSMPESVASDVAKSETNIEAVGHSGDGEKVEAILDKELSRPQSTASHVSEKADEKSASRPESAASHISEKSSTEKPPLSSDTASQDKDRPSPVASETSDKQPVNEKDASRPASVASHISEKESSKAESEKGSSRPASVASHVSEKADKSPAVESVSSVKSQESESASKEECKDTKTDEKEASHPESTASHISEKAAPKDEKEASRPESTASHVSEKAATKDEKEASRPESAASHVSEKSAQKDEKEPSRPESAASHVSEKAAPKDEKEASRPESAASHVSEKAATKDEKVASRPESAASHVNEKAATKDEKEASRPESAASHVSEKAAPKDEKEASRPESAASHVSEKAVTKDEKEASRPESAASHVSEKAATKDEKEASRPESAASHVSEKAAPKDEKEASRPESAASHVSEKAATKDEKEAPRPESATSHVSEKAATKDEKEASRPESAASHVSEKAALKDEKEASRPESAASHVSEKAAIKDEKEASRPESAASHVSEKTAPKDEKEASRPESTASHVSEKAATKDEKEASRPGSAASHISEKAATKDEKEASRPESAASHVSEKATTKDEKEASRLESTASHVSEKTSQAAIDKSAEKDFSRPDSPASCSSDKVTAPEDPKPSVPEKDLARKDSNASYHGEPIPGEETFSRPDSPASCGEDKEIPSEKVAVEAKVEVKQEVVTKSDDSKEQTKEQVPSGQATKAEGGDFSRPDSPASCGDERELSSKAPEPSVPEKDLARQDSSASYHGEPIPDEKQFSRPDSPASCTGDDVVAADSEIVTGEKGKTAESSAKEELKTDLDAAKQKQETSRPESAASHVSDKSAVSEKSAVDGKQKPDEPLSRRESAAKEDRPASASSDHEDDADEKVVLKETRSKSLSAVMSTTTQRIGLGASALGVLEETMTTSRDDLHVLKTPRESITKIEALDKPDQSKSESKIGKPLFGLEQFPADEKKESNGFPVTGLEHESPDETDAIIPGVDVLLKETASSMKEIEKMSTSVISMIKTTEKKDESAKVEEKSSTLAFPLLDSGKSTPLSTDKDKSQASSIKSVSPHEKDSLEGSSASLNTFIEKDSLSESTTKQVTIKMSTVEESAATTFSTSSKMESSELLGSGTKTPPTAPISPNVVREDFSLGHQLETTVASSTATTITSSSLQMAKQQQQQQHKDDLSGISTPKESVPSGKSSPGLMSVHTGSTDSASKSINLGHSSGIETSESSPKPTSPFPKVMDPLKTDEVKTSSGMSTPDMTRTSTPDMVDSQIERIPQDGQDKTVTTTTTTTTKTIRYIIKNGEKIEVGTTVKTDVTTDSKKDDSSSVGESMSTSSVTTTTTTTKDAKEAVKTPANLTLASTEDRNLTEEYDDKEVLSPRSDISSGQASRIVAGWHDEDVPGSPMSVTSQAPLSPSTKYTYDYDLQHSSSGVSKKSDIEIDDSQDEIPPQYGSEEVKSAITIASAYKADPMSTSFYGQLPDISDSSAITTTATTKSVPIPISAGKIAFAKTYMEYPSSGESSVDSSHHKTASERKYLDEADLDFEKAFTASDQVDIMTTSMHFSSEKEFMAATTAASSATTTVADSSKKELDFTASGLPSTLSTSSTIQQAQSTSSSSTTAQSTTTATTTSSSVSSTSVTTSQTDKGKDTLASWGKPLGLPSPAPMNDDINKTTPKKERKMMLSKTKLNNEKNLRKRSESPIKASKKSAPVYVDLSYVPHHGNSYYANVEFFKRVRARYYVFSGTEPSREVYNALLEAKQTWEDKDLEVTIIPTYDTDVLGYWVSENEDLLAKYHIDLSPSAARCTINLQDHETSCSAYRLEF